MERDLQRLQGVLASLSTHDGFHHPLSHFWFDVDSLVHLIIHHNIQQEVLGNIQPTGNLVVHKPPLLALRHSSWPCPSKLRMIHVDNMTGLLKSRFPLKKATMYFLVRSSSSTSFENGNSTNKLLKNNVTSEPRLSFWKSGLDFCVV